MQRYHDWPERFVRFIASRESQPFTWGKNRQDCCSFGNANVVALTGEDPMADLPEYATAEEADLILSVPLVELIDARLPRRDIGEAMRGDVALAMLPDLRGRLRETIVVVEGPTLVGPGLRRLQRVPRGDMLICWSV